LSSFGLSKEYRNVWLREIHDLILNSNGGITWEEAYHMPVKYRRFHLKQIIDQREKENEEVEKQKGNITMKDMINGKKKPIKTPDFVAKKSPGKK